MKALLAHGAGAFAVQDVPDPVLEPGGVVIEVEAAGVCAADRMLWTGHHPWGQLAWPFVPGHELLGRVTASDRADAPAGTRVTCEVMLGCGECPACAAGREQLCRHGRHLGSGVPGAFAERVGLPREARLHPVPDGLPRDRAVLAEPMACAVHAVRRGEVGPGDRVTVIGIGAIGALALHAARAAGAREVGAVTRSAARAELAGALGAGELSGPPDVVLECSGDPRAVGDALRLVADGGRVVLYGVYPEPGTVDLNLIAEFKELTVRGAHLAPGAFPEAIGLLGGLPVDLVTAARPLTGFAAALGPAPADRLRCKEILLP